MCTMETLGPYSRFIPSSFGYMKMRVAVDDPGGKASIGSSEQIWKIISTCFHKTGGYYLSCAIE